MMITRPTERPAPPPLPHHWRADGAVYRYERGNVYAAIWPGTKGEFAAVHGPYAVNGEHRHDMLTLDEHERWGADLVALMRHLRARRAL